MYPILFLRNFVLAVFFMLAAAIPPSQAKSPPDNADQIAVADLPKEARQTLLLIRSGGPFPFEKDGTVFGNREKQLPKQRRGYYKEYTVKTPGARDRGAKRFIVGDEPKTSTEIYYTDDHYQTFKRLRE
jgi:ribonuclease T1